VNFVKQLKRRTESALDI